MKKQTQFDDEQIGVKSYLKGNYDKNPACGAQKNKANLLGRRKLLFVIFVEYPCCSIQ
ncbi:MAG: hypothetical protein ACYS3S_01970 [Planctomycetota bacterium]